MIEKLALNSSWKRRQGPLVLCILDGIANGKNPAADAVFQAETPCLDWLAANCPQTELQAHGKAVGMPSDSDMGNSEVGHNALGAGRIFQQGASLVQNSLQEKTIFQGQVWQKLLDNVIARKSTLHLLGLLSDGNVHSHIDHVYKIIAGAVEAGCQRIRLHALLDGRDVGEYSALEYVEPMEQYFSELQQRGIDVGFASGGGRMLLTMDRYEADWPMVERGWQHHVLGKGEQFASASAAIKELRSRSKVTDQYLPPFIIADQEGRPAGPILDGDSVILFNFRGDRAIEICRAFTEANFDKFDRQRLPACEFAGMMEYDGDLKIPPQYLVDPPAIDRTLSELLVASNIRQYAISETQKYGHITYFFNGNRSGKYSEELEDFCEIPSLNIPFEQQPRMQAEFITAKVIEALDSGNYDFIRINYPNGDMIGHTGDFAAVKEAVSFVDQQLQQLLDKVREKGGIMLITADHGNSDEMYQLDSNNQIIRDEKGEPLRKSSHSLNPVPCYLFDPQYHNEYPQQLRRGAGLSAVAATCIDLLGLIPPQDYQPSLIKMSY